MRLSLPLTILLLLSSMLGQALPPTPTPKPVPPADQTGLSAKLEVLGPAPELIQTPANLTGEFTVATVAPKIRFATLPGQYEGGELWSNWGDALWASDGNIYCSIGDHASIHGHAFVYRINPRTNEITLVVDTSAILKRPDGEYSPGKIHGTLKELGDGWLYFATYRGSAKATNDTYNYQGDWFFRYHLETGKTENLGILVPYCSVPVMQVLPAKKLIYGLGVPGQNHPDKALSKFFVYDQAGGKLLYNGGPPTKLLRAMMLADDGRAWYDADGLLQRYDPTTNTVNPTTIAVPGSGNIRAATQPDAQGVIYGFTQAGDGFKFDTKTEAFSTLPASWIQPPLYTTVLRLSADGRYLYYVPGAHGGSSKSGTPVVRMTTATGERTVMAFLNPVLKTLKNYHTGGTFGTALSPDGTQFFGCWNGGLATQKKPDFGLASAILLDFPQPVQP
jgi:hypothetical protein